MKSTIKLLWVLLILIVWEASTRTGIVSTYILPPFSEVLKNLLKELQEGVLLIQAFNSMRLVLFGFVTSVIAAIILSSVCVVSSVFESFVTTVCTIMNPLPGVALIPVFMMWFGMGNGVLLALVAHGMLWPLVTNLLAGFRSIPTIYTEWAENIECPFGNKLLHLYLFSAIPYLLSGLRVGWGRAWRALIAGEMVFGMIGTLGGLGYYIYKARAYGNMEDVFSGIFLIVIIGLLIEEVIFKTIEHNTVQKWGMSIG